MWISKLHLCIYVYIISSLHHSSRTMPIFSAIFSEFQSNLFAFLDTNPQDYKFKIIFACTKYTKNAFFIEHLIYAWRCCRTYKFHLCEYCRNVVCTGKQLLKMCPQSLHALHYFSIIVAKLHSNFCFIWRTEFIYAFLHFKRK